MKKNDSKAQVAIAVHACQEKKATDISILRLDAEASGFTDYFIICSGSNPRQIQAIGDEVDKELSAIGVEPRHREGYTTAEWILLDYVDFVVHIFSESARKFYDLERLWKTATRVALADLEKPAKPATARKSATKKSAVKTAGRSAAKKAAAKKSSRTQKGR